ncbi:MAG: DUF3108 domain-containing protein, partial [Haliea sp.]
MQAVKPATAHRTGPPWRTLAILALLVLAAHVLLLRQMPARFGLAPDEPPKPTASFTTRTIQPPPPPVAIAKPAPQRAAMRPALARPVTPKPVDPAQPAPEPL